MAAQWVERLLGSMWCAALCKESSVVSGCRLAVAGGLLAAGLWPHVRLVARLVGHTELKGMRFVDKQHSDLCCGRHACAAVCWQ